MLYKPIHFKQNRLALLDINNTKKLEIKEFQKELENQIIKKIDDRTIKVRDHAELKVESYYSKNIPFLLNGFFSEAIDRLCPKNVESHHFLRPNIRLILKPSNFIIYNLEKPDTCFQFSYNDEFNSLLINLEKNLISKDFLMLIEYENVGRLLKESIFAVSVNDYRNNNEFSYVFIIIVNRTKLIDQYNMDSILYESYNDPIILDPNPTVSRYNYCKDWREKGYFSDVNIGFINRCYKPLNAKTPVIINSLPYLFDFF